MIRIWSANLISARRWLPCPYQIRPVMDTDSSDQTHRLVHTYLLEQCSIIYQRYDHGHDSDIKWNVESRHQLSSA